MQIHFLVPSYLIFQYFGINQPDSQAFFSFPLNDPRTINRLPLFMFGIDLKYIQFPPKLLIH